MTLRTHVGREGGTSARTFPTPDGARAVAQGTGMRVLYENASFRLPVLAED